MPAARSPHHPHPGPRSPPSLPPPLPATPGPPQAALSSWFASWSKTVVALDLRPRPDSVISSSSDPVGLTFRSRWAALQPAWGVARRSHVPSWPLSASPGPTQAVRPRARIRAFKIRSFSASKPRGPHGTPQSPAGTAPCTCPLLLPSCSLTRPVPSNMPSVLLPQGCGTDLSSLPGALLIY